MNELWFVDFAGDVVKVNKHLKYSWHIATKGDENVWYIIGQSRIAGGSGNILYTSYEEQQVVDKFYAFIEWLDKPTHNIFRFDQD